MAAVVLKEAGTEVRLALYDELDPTVAQIAVLRDLGVADDDMTVLSGVPYPEAAYGRPITWERLPRIAAGGAVVGLLIGLFVNVATPLMYPIRVGGQPYVAGPPALVLTYEFIMMGLIVSTFLGVLWESAFPTFGPKRYHPGISGGSFGVAFRAPAVRVDEIVDVLLENGASSVVNPEHWTL